MDRRDDDESARPGSLPRRRLDGSAHSVTRNCHPQSNRQNYRIISRWLAVIWWDSIICPFSLSPHTHKRSALTHSSRFRWGAARFVRSRSSSSSCSPGSLLLPVDPSWLMSRCSFSLNFHRNSPYYSGLESLEILRVPRVPPVFPQSYRNTRTSLAGSTVSPVESMQRKLEFSTCVSCLLCLRLCSLLVLHTISEPRCFRIVCTS